MASSKGIGMLRAGVMNQKLMLLQPVGEAGGRGEISQVGGHGSAAGGCLDATINRACQVAERQ